MGQISYTGEVPADLKPTERVVFMENMGKLWKNWPASMEEVDVWRWGINLSHHKAADRRDVLVRENSAYLGPAAGPAAFAPQAGAVRINNNKDSQLHSYAPGMHSRNAYNPDVQAVRLRADDPANHRTPVNDTAQFMQFSGPGATTACKARLPEENRFNDSVVNAGMRKQLTDNPIWQPFPI